MVDFRKRITPTFSYYCCSVEVLLVIKIRLKPCKRVSAYFVTLQIAKNRSLGRYSAIRYREDNFLPSFIFLLASCFSFVLAVACELTTNHLLTKSMKSAQDLMTDLG